MKAARYAARTFAKQDWLPLSSGPSSKSEERGLGRQHNEKSCCQQRGTASLKAQLAGSWTG